MPRSRSTYKIPLWAENLLQTQTLGQLQAGKAVPYPVRVEMDKASAWPYRIDTGYKMIRGTGIPASTWKRYIDKKQLSRIALHKLRLYHDRLVYAQLRAAGVYPKIASKYRRNKTRAEEYIEFYRRAVKGIAESKGVDPRFIVYGMSRSDRTKSDWEEYIRVKKYDDFRPIRTDKEWENYIVNKQDVLRGKR